MEPGWVGPAGLWVGETLLVKQLWVSRHQGRKIQKKS